MFLIEPCCTQKHWPRLRDKIKKGGTMMFHGYGDLSLFELMPVIMTRYSNTDVTIVCPAVKDGVAELLMHWMDKTKGAVHTIRHMTLITDLGKKKSPLASAWMKENPYPERLTPYNIQQNDTCILLSDLAIHGAVNLVHGGHFTALATTSPKIIASLREVYGSLTKKAE